MGDIHEKILAVRNLCIDLQKHVQFTMPFEFRYQEGTKGLMVELDVAGQNYFVDERFLEPRNVHEMLGFARLHLEKHIAVAKAVNAYCLAANVKLFIEVVDTTNKSHLVAPCVLVTARLGDIALTERFYDYNLPAAHLCMLELLKEEIDKHSTAQTSQATLATQ